LLSRGASLLSPGGHSRIISLGARDPPLEPASQRAAAARRRLALRDPLLYETLANRVDRCCIV